MRILRPVLLGCMIAFIVVMGLILLPKRTNNTVQPPREQRRQERSARNEGEEGALPPKLFPVFPHKRTPIRQPLVRVTKVPLTREVTPGSSFPISVTVDNIGEEHLSDLMVEERFDASLLSVSDTKDGTVEKNVVRWTIPELRPTERWSGNYTARLSKTLAPGTIETTLIVTGDDLHGTPTSSRMTTSVLTIIPLPRTGREIPFPLRLLLP